MKLARQTSDPLPSEYEADGALITITPGAAESVQLDWLGEDAEWHHTISTKTTWPAYSHGIQDVHQQTVIAQITYVHPNSGSYSVLHFVHGAGDAAELRASKQSRILMWQDCLLVVVRNAWPLDDVHGDDGCSLVLYHLPTRTMHKRRCTARELFETTDPITFEMSVANITAYHELQVILTEGEPHLVLYPRGNDWMPPAYTRPLRALLRAWFSHVV